MTTPCRDVLFPAGDEQCHAWLYLPDPDPSKSERPPVIVMGHGLGAVKALRLGAFAERFQAAGYACLVFDYRYFGDSTGEPRELLSISRQREDWRAALNFVRTLPEVDGDRVVLWGTSFAGGHVIATAAAAANGEVVAAVVQCPFTDGRASAAQISTTGKLRLGVAAAKDNLARITGRAPVRVKVAARPGETGLMDAPDVIEGVLRLLAASGIREEEYRNEVPARVALEIPLATPGRSTSKIRCPILFCVCDNDTVAPADATLRHAANAPRGQVRQYPVGHFDIYDGEEFEQVLADQLAFLQEHVPPDG